MLDTDADASFIYAMLHKLLPAPLCRLHEVRYVDGDVYKIDLTKEVNSKRVAFVH
jgi:hypothetical protein